MKVVLVNGHWYTTTYIPVKEGCQLDRRGRAVVLFQAAEYIRKLVKQADGTDFPVPVLPVRVLVKPNRFVYQATDDHRISGIDTKFHDLITFDCGVPVVVQKPIDDPNFVDVDQLIEADDLPADRKIGLEPGHRFEPLDPHPTMN